MTARGLAAAIANSKLDRVAAMLLSAPSLATTIDPINGTSALHRACNVRTTKRSKRTASCAIVALLFNAGASPNAQNRMGLTPTHYAACHGRLDVLRLLLRFGGETSLIVASRYICALTPRHLLPALELTPPTSPRDTIFLVGPQSAARQAAHCGRDACSGGR